MGNEVTNESSFGGQTTGSPQATNLNDSQAAQTSAANTGSASADESTQQSQMQTGNDASTGDQKEDYTKEISVNQDLLTKYGTKNGDLRFQFCGYWKQTHGHWKVFIYDKNYQSFDKFHYAFNGVMIQQIDKSEIIENLKCYKEHIIKNRNYKDLVEWSLDYDQKYAKYTNFHTNCRRFVIRLAEYCQVSINEIDGQMSAGLKLSNQMYTVGDGIDDIVKGVQKIGVGDVGAGIAQIGLSPFKTVAKLGVDTAKSIENRVQTIEDSFDQTERERQKNRSQKIKFLPSSNNATQ